MTTPTSPQLAAFLQQAATNPRPTQPDDAARLRARTTAPRPVPTTEDRMRDARTDRTFATYLDATERDQLDARAATAEQERDEALDARDVLRQQLDTARAELGAAQELLAVVDDLAEQLDRARARYATRPEVTPFEPEPRHPGDALADAQARAIVEAAKYEYGARYCMEGDCDHAAEADENAPDDAVCPLIETRYATAAEILAVELLLISNDGDQLGGAEEIPVGEIRRVLGEAREGEQPRGLGSAAPHAQEARL